MPDQNNDATDEWEAFKEWLPGARIAAVHIRNFRGIVDLKITDWDERGTLFLIGPNGSGKSTVLYALRWLFGDDNFVDSGNCEHKYPNQNDVAIEVSGDVESNHSEFFDWPKEFSSELPHVKVLFKDKNKEYFALRRYDSKKWKYRRFQRGEDGKELEGKYGAQDMGVHLLSLSPTEAGVREVPSQVRKIISQYLTNLLYDEISPRESLKMAVDSRNTVAEEVRGIEDDFNQETTSLIGGFKSAFSNVSQSLGTQAYKTQYELNTDKATNAMWEHLKREAIISRVIENLMDEVGVIATQITPHSGGAQTKQKEKGHSAGTLQSLALLNLYCWLEGMRSYYSSKGNEGPLFLLFLEEPEVFLHPQWARVFSDTLSDLGKDSGGKNPKMPVQAMVTTHSPIFARVDRHKQLQIHRAVHDADRRYRVYAYSGENGSKTHIKSRLNHIAQFHPTVNELFFAKRVALVEGPTEMWLFPTFARWLWNREWDQNADGNKGQDPTYNTTLIPCGPSNMKDLIEILSRLGVKPIVVHDLDPLKKKSKEGSKPSIVERNRKIEAAIRKFGGNPKKQLRRLNPDVEGVMGYEAPNDKPYRALLFLTWLFKGYWGETNKDGTNCGDCVKREGLLYLIADWEEDSREGNDGSREYNNSPFSPLVTRGTCGVPTVGSNFLYLLDVITEIYTPPGDERTRRTWQIRKKEFINYLHRRGVLTFSGQIMKPEEISVRKEKKEKKCLQN